MIKLSFAFAFTDDSGTTMANDQFVPVCPKKIGVKTKYDFTPLISLATNEHVCHYILGSFKLIKGGFVILKDTLPLFVLVGVRNVLKIVGHKESIASLVRFYLKNNGLIAVEANVNAHNTDKLSIVNYRRNDASHQKLVLIRFGIAVEIGVFDTILGILLNPGIAGAIAT